MKEMLRDLEGFIIVLAIAVILWLSVSFVDVLWSNRDPFTDHDPHAWNAFQIMYQIGDAAR